MNLQHYLWREALGYSLYPAVLAATKEQTSLKIADVATGTGIWLYELAEYLPASTQLDGFDVCPDQFPHQACLPNNVNLRVLDAKASPPEELCAIYDVVHVRMLLAVVDEDDPTPILKHCLKLLSTWIILLALKCIE